jgi:LuxR family maltose regulon positive regulatory protein
LTAKLGAGCRSGSKLVLVSAPVGYGKTTLVAEWAAGSVPPVGWFTLDVGDNDPLSFLSYLVAALRSPSSTSGHVRQPFPARDVEGSGERVLDAAINEVTEMAQDRILVLDDYHQVRNERVTQLLAYLIDHQPRNLHLVLVTRVDPALRLGRLRARGELLEVRAHDLRFTEDEAAEFLTRAMGLHLDPCSIHKLTQRTEGWIGGLQLAALSLQGRDDVEAFIEAFSGSHRYVVDYLVDEVLSKQPPDVREFLVQTSVLERLCAPLCNAVVRIPSAAGERRFADSRAMLTYLENANLFLVPLDDRREWYRYHHLFASSLRTQLEDAERAELHRRAAEWFAENDLPTLAVHHGLKPLTLQVEGLSVLEVEILRLLAQGLSNQEIGQALFLSTGTVKWYLNQLYGKLEVNNRTQAATRARELGLLS